MNVAIEYEIGVYICEDFIQIDGTRVMDDGPEVNLRLCEAVVKKRYSHTFIHILNQVRPFSHCIAQGRIKTGMYPLVMFQLAVAHPRGLWLWKPGRKPGVMIAANQIHARRAQQQFQAFCWKWADAYGIACVKNRVSTLLPNCSQGNLKCRQIAVDICQDRYLHVNCANLMYWSRSLTSPGDIG